MIKRAVLLIAIVVVCCVGFWGQVRSVSAATSISWVKQDPTEPVDGMAVVVWVKFNGLSDITPLIEYKVDGISSIIPGSEDYPLGFDANWKFIIPAHVQGKTVTYQLLYRNADNSLGGYTGFNWSYTVKILNAIVDQWFDEGSPNYGKTSFNNIQSAVNVVDAGAVIQVNQGTYSGPITINKPLTIRGVGSDSDVPQINGKIILQSQGTETGLVKLFNLKFRDADEAIKIGDLPDANFGEILLSQLTFGTSSPGPNSKAIQTASSIQIYKLSVLDCVINAAFGIGLNGDIGSIDISRNTFIMTGQTAGSFGAITINQDTKAIDSVNKTGTLTIQGNTLDNPSAEPNSYGSAILNQASFAMTSSADGKELNASGNSFNGSFDQTQFIQDKIADFVLVNNAPVANSQTLTTAEDTDLNITLAVFDAEADPLTYELVTEPQYGTFSGTLPNLTYTPTANYNGSDSFSFKANDGKADSNTATVNITVSAVNDVPVTQNQFASTTEDNATKVTLVATDVDSETLTFSILSGPIYGSVILSDNELTYTPFANYFGEDSLTFKANDGEADSLTSKLAITISSVNDVPILIAIQAQVIDEEKNLSFTAAASDVDLPEQKLTFSLEDAPTGASIDPDTGIFTWTPSEIQGPQGYTLKVCVSDGEVIAPYCQDVAVMVNEVNLPPLLSIIPAQTVNEGEELIFAFSGSDPDLPKQLLTFTIMNAPTGSSFDSASQKFEWTPIEGQGSQTFKPSICISDGVVTTPTCQEVTITVESVNSEPNVDEITAQTVDEGVLLSFSVVANDTDLPEQTLSYSFSGTVPTGMQIDASTGVVTWTPSEEQGNQDFTVKVCVSDGVVNICQSVNITVYEVNAAPTLVPILNQTVIEGELLTFTAEGKDEDLPQQTLKFSLDDAPTGAEIDPDSGLFTWTPGEVSEDQDFALKVCVADDTATTCQDLTIKVVSVVVPPTEFLLYLPIISR